MWPTRDRATKHLKFYTKEKLSERRSLTPEGFLLIEGVPIARTGTMVYGSGQVPVDADNSGLIRITRDAEDLFRPETIASFAGKPITDDHPYEDVRPDNWRDLAKGTVLNPRRGEGVEDDYLFADLLITDKPTIAAVNSGKVQVSCGYDADYEQLDRGIGRQTNIIGNHVALVEAGRCGPRCAIGDQAIVKEQSNMAKKSVWQRLRDAISTKDEAAAMEAAQEAEATTGSDEDGNTHVHVHIPSKDEVDSGLPNDEPPSWFKEHVESNNARFSAIEKICADMAAAMPKVEAHATQDAATKAAADEADRAKKDADELAENLVAEVGGGFTKDSAAAVNDSVCLQDSFQNVVAAAEILVPGIRVPTFDRAAAPKATMDAVCGLRRKTLDLAYLTVDTRQIIEEILAGKDFDLKSMTCDAVRTLFVGVVAAKKAANNASNVRTGDFRSKKEDRPKVASLSDLNKMHSQHYAGRQ